MGTAVLLVQWKQEHVPRPEDAQNLLSACGSSRLEGPTTGSP